jgi:hypothetical protein
MQKYNNEVIAKLHRIVMLTASMTLTSLVEVMDDVW